MRIEPTTCGLKVRCSAGWHDGVQLPSQYRLHRVVRLLLHSWRDVTVSVECLLKN
jgi:hypothetical protein